MNRTDISPEMLNAYVDGELASADAARVARMAARNRAIASQIATLREMKAAMADAVPDGDAILPEPKRPARKYLAMASAAAVIAFLFSGLLYSWLTWPTANDRFTVLLNARHTAWTFSSTTKAPLLRPARAVSALLPLDLKAARLSFAGFEEITYGETGILRTGYEGTRGCKVSLYVYPSTFALQELLLSPSLLVQSWVLGGHGFTLMADGMAEARFHGLAIAIEKTLRSGLEMDTGTRQQLAKARRTSPPCRT